MKTVKFGVIGLGLMGREFGSASARWGHLPDMEVKPEIVAVCDKDLSLAEWFTRSLPSVSQVTDNYRELLSNPDVDAVYCPVPHHLHESIYVDIIEAGKHLFGEKPFGIDEKANGAILKAVSGNPNVFVRCASEFPFFPAMQRVGEMIERGDFGRIIEVEAGFLHSSDLNPEKPINWKRMIEYNGEYGCMGDLGMHVCHVPFRAGWIPMNVRACLSNLVPNRPDGKGGRADCLTWDNAVLFCETREETTGNTFPLVLKTHRIAPGESNTWYITILGMKKSVRFSTKRPNRLDFLEYRDGIQNWQVIETGQTPAFSTITGPIFEFGFSDGILQMWAGYLHELAGGKPLRKFAGCVTPDETALSHRLFTAALESQRESATVVLKR